MRCINCMKGHTNMKKKLPLLLVLPAMMLSSCGYGAEVTDSSEIKGLMDGISAKTEEVKNLEMRMTTKTTAYDEDLKKNVTTDGNLIFCMNSESEMYMYTSSKTSEGEKSEETVYYVKDQNNKTVLAVQEYNPETKKNNDIVSYGENDSEIGLASFVFLAPLLLYATYANPTSFVATLNDESGLAAASVELASEAKYYSRGEGNLTIVIEAKTTVEVKKEDKEQTVSETETIIYDNYHISKVVSEGVTNKGNNTKAEMSFNIKDSLAIDLPASWVESINKKS